MDQSINILLVEDSDTDAFIASRMIMSVYKNCNIDHVYNGKQALEYMFSEENPKPDLIITDLNMPVMNGQQMLVNISNTESLSNIKVAVVTSSGHMDDIDQCMASGANRCIEKPLSQEVTRELIESLVLKNTVILTK
ncbi:MAG: response regulator [Bacteroidota bacterium]